MKILQINRYHHLMGGSETVYFNTAKLLKKKGHEVFFFAMDYPENIECKEKSYFAKSFDFNTLDLNNKIKNFKSFFYNKNAEKNLERLIIAIKPDVAHIHLFYGSLTSSILVILKKLGVPIVITAHDYRLICPSYLLLDGKNQICEECEGHKFYNCIINKCAKKSYVTSALFALESYYRTLIYPPQKYVNKIIFVSKFSLNMHLKYKAEFKDKAIQLYNFNPRQRKNILPNKGDYFLYFGRLSPEKGIFTLIDAFNSRPNYKLKIAGSGPLVHEVLQRKKNNIEYVGFSRDKELEDLITKCSFVIVPSECYETLSMAAVESLALGKPVVAANIGGLPEVVNNEKNGYLFDAFSTEDLQRKIDIAYLTTPEQYELLSQSASKENEKFNEDLHYISLLDIYKSAINTNKK